MQDNKVYMLINEMSSNLILWVIQTLVMRGVWILKFPRHVTSSPLHVEFYRGKAPNEKDGISNDAINYVAC